MTQSNSEWPIYTHTHKTTLNIQFKFSNSRFPVPFQGLVVPRDDRSPYPVHKPRFLVGWSCAPLRIISCCGTALPARNKQKRWTLVHFYVSAIPRGGGRVKYRSYLRTKNCCANAGWAYAARTSHSLSMWNSCVCAQRDTTGHGATLSLLLTLLNCILLH